MGNHAAIGLTWERPGRWGGIHGGLVSPMGYIAFDWQLAPMFYDEPALAKGNFARTIELHMGGFGLTLPLGVVNVMSGLGVGISEVGPYDPETTSGDVKSGFLQLEAAIAPPLQGAPFQIMAVPYVGFCGRPVHRADNSLGNRYGVDIYAIASVPGVFNVFTTIGWSSYSISDVDTMMPGVTDRLTGWSVLVGITPAFIFK